MVMKIGVFSLLLAVGAGPVSAQEKPGLGDDDRFEGKPYPGCLEASEYGHAAFMSRYQDVPLSSLVEENHRRHEPDIADAMDRIAMRAYKVRAVPASEAPRIAAVFRDTLYLSCVERLKQSRK